jgi:YfiH family protein
MTDHVWIRKGTGHELMVREKDGVPYLSFAALEQTGLVVQGFSTRLGGVSTGDCATMNFSVSRGDTEENVRENYRRMGKAMGFSPERLVLSWQTHTTNIRMVTEEDAGKGFCRERDYRDIDGLMTNVPGIPLVTLYADCVPLFFLDPVKKVIAASHSGWRGTAAGMGRCTVKRMEEAYGCDPGDILAAIGPSICGNCYEIGPDVAQFFAGEFLRSSQTKPGKYQLDLQAANRRILEEAGVQPEHIIVGDICTCCNKELLFSHRGSMGHRGNMAGFLMLK